MWEWTTNLIENEKYFEADEKTEAKVDFRIIDIPGLHRLGGNCMADKFFEALSNLEIPQEEKKKSLFANPGVQAIIDFGWNIVQA